jgi:hypothetical protein
MGTLGVGGRAHRSRLGWTCKPILQDVIGESSYSRSVIIVLLPRTAQGILSL